MRPRPQAERSPIGGARRAAAQCRGRSEPYVASVSGASRRRAGPRVAVPDRVATASASFRANCRVGEAVATRTPASSPSAPSPQYAQSTTTSAFAPSDVAPDGSRCGTSVCGSCSSRSTSSLSATSWSDEVRAQPAAREPHRSAEPARACARPRRVRDCRQVSSGRPARRPRRRPRATAPPSRRRVRTMARHSGGPNGCGDARLVTHGSRRQ